MANALVLDRRSARPALPLLAPRDVLSLGAGRARRGGALATRAVAFGGPALTRGVPAGRFATVAVPDRLAGGRRGPVTAAYDHRGRGR